MRGAIGFGVLAVTMGLGALGCGDDTGGGEPAACLTDLPRDCSIVWADYDAIWRNGMTTCGSADTGPFCHSAEGQMAGLNLSDQDTAYEALLGGLDGRARVIPGDPECSVLMQRLESEDPAFQMPPSGRMTDAERCSIIKWIAEGANR